VTRAPRRLVILALAGAIAVGCGACAPGAPIEEPVSLDLVRAERAERLVGIWYDSAQITQRELRERWPESPPLQFRFTEWVEPTEYRQRLLRCIGDELGREVDDVGTPAIAGEQPWEPAAAEALCRHEFPPFSAEFSLGGPIEARWLDHQLSVVLPACVRSFGGRLEIADTAPVIDAIRDRPRSFEGPRDIFSIVAVSGVSALDVAAMRASCPDPGLALDALPLPVIDR